jgi:4-diphosphocytidyl-2-C-methyl-D-erythritol kinase
VVNSLLDVSAPAKLNLFLHITGRRNDGYHLLQSVFMLIDWCDTLHFELRQNSQGQGNISREDLTTKLPEDDLILKAARALQAATGTAMGAHISIAKSIPAQAGMGGGSSDAASTLLALNRLWKLNLSKLQLAQIGLKLGADVPFFIHGNNAWVEGIGELITPIDLPKAHFLIVKPESGLPTQAIFNDPALKRDTQNAIISGFAADPFGFGRNDLQTVAQTLCPDVSTALNWLERMGLQPRMTGSGSAVFAYVSEENLIQFEQLADLVNSANSAEAPKGSIVKICSNLAEHPLRNWAN